MTGTRVFASVLAICLFLLSCSSYLAVDTVGEAQKIRELDRLWLLAFADKDIDGAMEFFANDAVLMPAHTPAIEGKQAIEAWFESWLPNPAVSSTFAPESVEVASSGEFAYDRGNYQFLMETDEGLIRDSGKYLIVWKKVDGEWKALLDISNSDLAAPEVLAAAETDQHS